MMLTLAFTASAQQSEKIAQQSESATSLTTLSPNEARAQRGFTSNTNFVPKGQWIFGGTASYSMHNNDSYKFTLIDNINSEGYTVNVSPMIAYAPWKNMAVGVRFAYGRSLLALDSASLAFGEGDTGININVDYCHQLKHSYTGTIFWRPYIPIGQNNRFAIFAEVQLNFKGAQSKIVAEDGMIEEITNYRGTFSNSFGGSVALQPGIVAFVTNNTALELSIGVFGIGYESIKQIKNQIESGKTTTSNMNFKVNLLSIGFGVSFYL